LAAFPRCRCRLTQYTFAAGVISVEAVGYWFTPVAPVGVYVEEFPENDAGSGGRRECQCRCAHGSREGGGGGWIAEAWFGGEEVVWMKGIG
jgi:hypothetical protein